MPKDDVLATLLVLYVFSGSLASPQLYGAQYDSSYTLAWFSVFRMADDEEVTTTRLMLGALALIDLSSPVVPLIAGSRNSLTGSSLTPR